MVVVSYSLRLVIGDVQSTTLSVMVSNSTLSASTTKAQGGHEEVLPQHQPQGFDYRDYFFEIMIGFCIVLCGLSMACGYFETPRQHVVGLVRGSRTRMQATMMGAQIARM